MLIVTTDLQGSGAYFIIFEFGLAGQFKKKEFTFLGISVIVKFVRLSLRALIHLCYLSASTRFHLIHSGQVCICYFFVVG